MWLVSFSAESAASRCLCKIGQGTGSSPEPRDPGDKQTQTRVVCMPVHVGADVGGHVVLGSSLRSQACRCSGWWEGGEIPLVLGTHCSGAGNYCPLLPRGGMGMVVGLS